MASEINEIKEIVEINDSTKKNENNNSEHSNGDINGNSDHDRGEDKKGDGRKIPLQDCCSSSSPMAPEIEDFNDNTNPPEPQLHAPGSQVREKYNKLDPQEQKCLSSFILLPENAVVKKRLLVYLWIGEDFLVKKTEEKTLEVAATEILNKFMKESFIQPVKKNCDKVEKSFKMPQDVHSVLSPEAKCLHSISDGKALQWFIDEVYLLKNSQYPKTKDKKVLYLGRWQSSAERHNIEVADSEFLKGLKNMENLRFLSLQGISGIQELPSRSISNLRNLRILDLRACYNLEKLPKEIASLKKLTHLDISECYLLDCMPKELLLLSELQVLKGFVITDTKNSIYCTLAELAGLKKLTKLSVNLNSENFSVENFSAVFKFKLLLKLKITWGGKFSKVNRNKKSQQELGVAKSKAIKVDNKRSLKRLESVLGEVTLEKLELQCLPHKTLPNWVHPDNLRRLKKLYIRGGGLKTLSRIQEGDKKWEVEALRLMYLNEFNMNWIELRALFPDLQYFEKFKCPKLTLCPCDCTGVWTPQPQTTS